MQLKLETVIKIIVLIFIAGVSYAGVSQKLDNMVTREEFVAESVHVANNYERLMWEIKTELEQIAKATSDNTARLREICLEFKSGCR